MFRRLFARVLDYFLYFTIWMLIVFLVHQWMIGLSGQMWLYCFFLGFFIAPIVLMLVVEPFLLHLFGTTFGKWLYGVFVIYDRGGKIPLEKARLRTIKAVFLWHGDYRSKDIFRFIDMIDIVFSGKPLDWDYEADTSICFKSKKNWKLVLMIIVIIGLYLILKYFWEYILEVGMN